MMYLVDFCTLIFSFFSLPNLVLNILSLRYYLWDFRFWNLWSQITIIYSCEFIYTTWKSMYNFLWTSEVDYKMWSCPTNCTLYKVVLDMVSVIKCLGIFKRRYLFFKRFYLFTFGERGREGERVEEKHWCVWGAWPGTQPHALTKNQTFGDLLVCGTMPNPLNHTSQGKRRYLLKALQYKGKVSGTNWSLREYRGVKNHFWLD